MKERGGGGEGTAGQGSRRRATAPVPPDTSLPGRSRREAAAVRLCSSGFGICTGWAGQRPSAHGQRRRPAVFLLK